MKKITSIICIAFAICSLLTADSFSQTLSPKVSPTCGGYFTGGGNSLSWTMGETFNTTLSSVNNKLTQGFQQPEISVYIFNVKALIEGFYLGSGLMIPVIDPVSQPLLSDTITLRLMRNTSPYDILFSSTSVLQTNGNAIFNFPVKVSSNSYYLSMKHRNAMETWSTAPVTINYNTKYDFTTAASKAYGNNMKDVGTPLGESPTWAFYSGDISDAILGVGYQDGVIESQDYSDMENAVYFTYIGYIVEDITGDGVVESADYSLEENNVYFTIVNMRP